MRPLISGEDLGSHALDDAQHWVVVFSELVGLLSSSGLPADIQSRYRRHLEHWVARRDLLVGLQNAANQELPA